MRMRKLLAGILVGTMVGVASIAAAAVRPDAGGMPASRGKPPDGNPGSQARGKGQQQGSQDQGQGKGAAQSQGRSKGQGTGKGQATGDVAPVDELLQSGLAGQTNSQPTAVTEMDVTALAVCFGVSEAAVLSLDTSQGLGYLHHVLFFAQQSGLAAGDVEAAVQSGIGFGQLAAELQLDLGPGAQGRHMKVFNQCRRAHGLLNAEEADSGGETLEGLDEQSSLSAPTGKGKASAPAGGKGNGKGRAGSKGQAGGRQGARGQGSSR